MNEKHVFKRGGRIYDQMCGICNAVADAPVHQMGDIQRAAAKEPEPKASPSDLIVFKWAETLSTGEQSVLLGGSLRRLQDAINSHVTALRKQLAQRERERLDLWFFLTRRPASQVSHEELIAIHKDMANERDELKDQLAQVTQERDDWKQRVIAARGGRCPYHPWMFVEQEHP